MLVLGTQPLFGFHLRVLFTTEARADARMSLHALALMLLTLAFSV
jgi:hypothetical protein